MQVTTSVEFDNIRRLPTKPGQTKPVLVTFRNQIQKLEVLKGRTNLAGSDMGISEDFSERVRAIRKTLNGFRKQARTDNKFAILKYDKIQINNELFKLDEDDELVLVKSFKPREKNEISGGEQNP